MKRTIALLLAVIMVLGLVWVPVEARAEGYASAEDCIKELIVYYKTYQEAAETDIQRVLGELEAIDPVQAEAWEQIMAYWSHVNTDMVVNVGTVPEGLPEDNSVAVIILGFALNADGTMKEELVGRLQTGLAIAEAYPESYVVVTGGGTAANNPDVTEGGLMGEWLLEQGLAEDRLIVENQAPNTVGNAENTYKILAEQYPQVKSLVMVTSDYHVPRGCILFYSKCLLAAYELGGEPLEMVSNAGYYTGSNGYESISLQASGVASVAGVSVSGVSVSLSKLVSLTASYDGELVVTAGYDSGYSRVVEAETDYDPALGTEQTVAVSYTENGITIELELALSEGSKTVYSAAHLVELVAEAKAIAAAGYTRESYAALQSAIAEAEAVLEQEELTLEQIDAAYDALQAAIDSLKTLVNIAYKMNVTANCNESAAYKVNDGTISTSNYWASVNSDGNVAAADAELVIDLDGTYDVEAIRVYPYWGGQRIYKYELYGSADGEAWEKIGENVSDEYVTSAGIMHEIDAQVAYVKLVGIETTVVGRADINNIHIVELQVFGQEVGNLALNKPTTSSGADQSASSSAGAVEAKVNDGDRTTYWDAGKYADSPWVIIDLEDVYLIDTVNVVSYFARNDRYYNYEVYASPDGEEYTLIAAKTETDYETIFGNTFDVTGGEVYARYIKVVGVYNSKNSAYHINEIRVYGSECDYELVLALRELNALIGNAEGYNEEDYTCWSWRHYEMALERAREAAASETATAEEVLKAAEQLRRAEEQLKLRPADYSAVWCAISKARRLDRRRYEDFTAVDEAIANVDWSKDFTEQEAVDAMAEAIEAAIDALVELECPQRPGRPGHPGKPEQPGKPVLRPW